MDKITQGGCLCGSVRYELRGALRPVVACHCTQCRKSSGHYVAATQVASKDAAIEGGTLRWFRSSPEAERGFCSACGRTLFWRRIDGDTGLRMESQLYPESAGDYYDLPDVPAIPQSELK